MTAIDFSLANEKWLAKAIKRGLDVCLSILLLILGFPVSLLIAILIKLDSPGAVFYRQQRVGCDGRLFEMIKFRTMSPGAPDNLETFLRGNPGRRFNWEQYQKLWKDPRLTRAGKWLRKFSLDEIPQLWNVLRGEMSLVGPRPIIATQRDMYGPCFSYYQQVRPGMTGLWQVNGRNRTSFSERVDWDVDYVKQWSLWLDIRVLIKTVSVVFRGDGAF